MIPVQFLRRILPGLAFLALGCSSVPEAPALSAADPPPVAELAAPLGPARAERVVIISVDGLRPDAIQAAGAATLGRLIERGAYCPKAETIRPSVTLPSHTAMLSGLDFRRHGVTWNHYRPGYMPYPTVFSVAHQCGRRSAMFFAKEKFHFLANPKCVSRIHGPPVPDRAPPEEDDLSPVTAASNTEAAPLARAFAEAWPDGKLDLTFVHFRECDVAGHHRGWMSPEYLEAVRTVDRAIGLVVETIETHGGFEKTALIVSADHGGSGYGHSSFFQPNRAENVTIPWICVGPGVPAGLRIDRVVRTYDTAPTALAFLGLGAPEGIDGSAVVEVLK